jgi:uncharacterized protein YdhG (YjbR/CyaY superfamily)
MNNRATDVDTYLSNQPEDARSTLEHLRRTIKAAVPDAAESIGYAMPAYKYRGKPLVYIGAARNHCAIYGLVPEGFEEELAAYDTSKGAIRFPFGQPPPEALIKALLSARTSEIEAAAAARKPRTSSTRKA